MRVFETVCFKCCREFSNIETKIKDEYVDGARRFLVFT